MKYLGKISMKNKIHDRIFPWDLPIIPIKTKPDVPDLMTTTILGSNVDGIIIHRSPNNAVTGYGTLKLDPQQLQEFEDLIAKLREEGVLTHEVSGQSKKEQSCFQ